MLNLQVKYSLLSILIIVLISGCNNSSSDKKQPALYFCDAEKVRAGEFFTNDTYFLNGQTQSDDFSRSGNFSSKVGGEIKYGIGLKLDNLLPEELIRAEVWCYGNDSSKAQFVVQGDWGLWFANKEIIETDANGWSKYRLEIYIPDIIDKGTLKIFTINEYKKPVYFDDLKIERLDEASLYMEITGLETLELDISDEIYADFLNKRLKAIQRGIILKEEKSFVTATLTSREKTNDVSIRFKGDWPDHLNTMKWSFRVKFDSGEEWNGMQEFSLQAPVTRGYLHEWVYHQLLKQEGVLAPKYGFVNLKVNGISKGIMAYEEHFSSDFIADNNLPASVILKFEEEEMWKVRSTNNGKDGDVPVFVNSKIECYDARKLSRNDSLNTYFNEAKKLLTELKEAQTPVSQIFDIEQLSKFYALIDLTNAFHSLIWHNNKFYYHPKTKKILPIGYDGYGSNGVYNWIKKANLMEKFNDLPKGESAMMNMYINVFDDSLFIDRYKFYLDKYVDENFIDGFLKNNSHHIEEMASYLKQETSYYRYDKNFLKKNAERIRQVL
ncbi:MAG: hypothetical protein COC01_02280 [Bacteroidetes bacterium]|nr:MAG: hypothetical protein COC01_02280 [Bacteroidota bacterium]